MSIRDSVGAGRRNAEGAKHVDCLLFVALIVIPHLFRCALIQKSKKEPSRFSASLIARPAAAALSLPLILTSFVLATGGKTWTGIFDPVNRMGKKGRGSRRDERSRGWGHGAMGPGVGECAMLWAKNHSLSRAHGPD